MENAKGALNEGYCPLAAFDQSDLLYLALQSLEYHIPDGNVDNYARDQRLHHAVEGYQDRIHNQS
jgi:hypothetical protein